jgi:hypothetical protein
MIRDMETDRPSTLPGWGTTGLLYTILTTLGVVAGFFVSIFFVLMLHGIPINPSPLSKDILKALEGGSLFGLILGVFQYAALRRLVLRLYRNRNGMTLDETGRRNVRDTADWIVATVAGTTAGSLIGVICPELIPQTYSGLRSAASLGGYGACLGATQWMVLRRWASGAALWIPCTAAGPALSVIGNRALTGLNLPLLGYGPIITLSVTVGLCLGIFQALCLRRLVARWKGIHPPRDGERDPAGS